MIDVFKQTRWMVLELLRQPAYMVSTLAFPCLFYVIFAVPESKGPEASNMLLASFSCFAFFGVLFLQFGASMAQERSQSWYYFLKTQPLSTYKLLLARFVSAYFFAFLSLVPLIFTAAVYTEFHLNFMQWIYFFAALSLPGLVFCFMGLCLGFLTNEKSALPVGNLIYLPLTFVGGLWKPPELLPENVQKLSEYLPTRHYGEILWSVVAEIEPEQKSYGLLLIYLFIFVLLSYVLFKKDHKERIA